MIKYLLFFVCSFIGTITANAQYVHVKMTNGTEYKFITKYIESMNVEAAPYIDSLRSMNPGDTVVGKILVNNMVYTRALGGTVGNPVDLGLPSGTLWADHNLGARNPEDIGAGIGWTDVASEEEGYENGVKTYNVKYKYEGKKDYDGKYKYSGGYMNHKYDTLQIEDDAATVNWGFGWKTPSKKNFSELLAYTKRSLVSKNGVTGFEFVSKVNGNSIFLPGVNEKDNYWTNEQYYYRSSPDWFKISNGVLSDTTREFVSRDHPFHIRPVFRK